MLHLSGGNPQYYHQKIDTGLHHFIRCSYEHIGPEHIYYSKDYMPSHWAHVYQSCLQYPAMDAWLSDMVYQVHVNLYTPSKSTNSNNTYTDRNPVEDVYFNRLLP